MKNVLVLVHDDAGQESRLQAALDLVRALDGHLHCIDVTIPPMPAGNPYDATADAVLIEAAREREDEHKAKVVARLAREDIAWDWADTTDTLASGAIEGATLADIIVLNRRLDSIGQPDMRAVAGNVAMRAHKPVVAVPESLTHFALGRALVAWDGQESCAATMRACVPLLSLAQEVEIFAVRNGNESGADPAEAAEYLSRHGIHAQVRIVEDGKTHPDALIGKEAADWQADYIVMGAYNRGRLAEVFGGVTKRLLGDSKVPLILGH